MARRKTTLQKANGPQGVPRHQLAPRHEGSNSGRNDPIGDLEARVKRLTAEMRHGGRECMHASRRIAKLSGEVERLQREIVELARAIDWAVNS
jgi:predicted RNase H-like nuclease (RuvC/YqgF family)